ncbi:MAG: FG-GAP repeat domain-containing protein [Chitinophagales bacterium]
MNAVDRRAWRPVSLILWAAVLMCLGTVGVYLYLARTRVPVAALTANSRIPAAYSFTALVKVKAGDVFGDGHDALVVTMPEPSKPFEWPVEEKPGDYVTAVYRVRHGFLDEVFRSAPQTMPVNELTLADTNGNGRQEIWFGYWGDLAQPAALEWEGTGFSPVPAWAGWSAEPVVLGAAPPAAGGLAAGQPAALLALSEYVSPELARDLEVVSAQGGHYIPRRAIRPGQPASPKDRPLIADLNGDGRLELLYVTGRMNLLSPPRPVTITRLDGGQTLLQLDGVFPDDAEVVDLNGNGVPEIYLSENLPLEVGKPYRGSVRGLEWDGRAFRQIAYEEFDNGRWVADLASGDFDGDHRPDLIIAILRATDAKRFRFELNLRGFGFQGRVARGVRPGWASDAGH